MSVPIPEGWEVDAIVSRVLFAGLCKYSDLVDGTLTLYDFYSLLRLIDWHDYAQAYADNTRGQ